MSTLGADIPANHRFLLEPPKILSAVDVDILSTVVFKVIKILSTLRGDIPSNCRS